MIPKELRKYGSDGKPESQTPAATAFRLQGFPHADVLSPLFRNMAAYLVWRLNLRYASFNERLAALQAIGFYLDE